MTGATNPGRLPEQVVAPSAGAARLRIDRAAIARNWRLLATRSRSAACAAVVKADAYGLGIEAIVPTLADTGCNTFFVAHMSEALRVRALLSRANIYVLNGLPPGSAQRFAESEIRPVLGSIDEIVEWSGFLRASGWRGGAALHVDTGMNRLGLTIQQARDIAELPDRPPLSLLMSHLACADVADHALNDRQIVAFNEVRRWFPTVPASLANSSGVFLPAEPHFDLVRPGAALYGVNPTPDQRNPMQPVVSLDAPVIQVRTVAAGETVGYGGAWTAARQTRLAIVSLGYADGFLRSASATDGQSGGEAMIGDRRRPIVGRISMDLVAVDITGIPEHEAGRGSFIRFIGPELTVDDVARHAGTIGYEVLTNLGRRFERTYLD